MFMMDGYLIATLAPAGPLDCRSALHAEVISSFLKSTAWLEQSLAIYIYMYEGLL